MNGFDARLDLVPQEPGVYLMKDASGCVIYVGKAKKLRNRLRSYFGDHDIPNNKVRAMVSHVADFEYVVVSTEAEALLLEANLIKRYQPHYNILLRDDKGYPYVCITMNEAFPRVMKVFRPDEEARKKGALYFGPYLNGDLFVFLKAIDAIFPLKKCARKLPRDIGKERPCLNYHIGKCLAPCNGGINADEYLKMMGNIVEFFEGRYDGIKSMIRQQMEKAAESYDFERASIYRDRLFALENITKSQKIFMDIRRDVDAIGIYSDAGESSIRKLELRDGRVVGSSTYFVRSEGSENSELILNFLMQYYDNAPFIPETIIIPCKLDDESSLTDIEDYLTGLAKHKVTIKVPERGELLALLKMAELNAREMMTRRILRGGGAGSDPNAAVHIIEKEFGIEEGSIKRIESFDISNLGNDDICSGMVVFTNGKADKQSYRLFKLKTVETQDDFASMREVLTRRFSHGKDDGFTYPELILADGGKGQVSAILEVLTELGLDDKILLAGMFKNKRHKTAGLVFPDGREIYLDKDNLNDDELVLLRFLTAVQNEVHRFAITYQRKLSKKRNLRYSLEEISGIGPAKRKKLLSHFGTIKKISEATREELLQCPSITEENADRIIEHFSKE
ncbi:MAG: excinuclease ABC subunit UvrC [Clostridiales bacterium]|nr:excinuclease ABC subunit UvrC [Clostridiales bacterium]